jgi:hypothetical protein
MAMEILLIEDNPGDVRLLEEAFRELGADVRLQLLRMVLKELTLSMMRTASKRVRAQKRPKCRI